MSGFSFPPPPPPPPKAPPAQQSSPYDSSTRGRGPERGRVGNWNGQNQRGRGQSQGRGHPASNGFHQPNSSQQQPWQRGPQQHSYNQHAHSNSTYGHHGSHGQRLSSGAFINPNFAAPQATYDNSSFSNGYAATQSFGATPEQANYHHSSPPRTTAGHKRKLDALRGPEQAKKAGPQTAPAVPGFGAPILSMKPSASSNDSYKNATRTRKPKVAAKSLGLTPGADEPHYSSSDNDEDEQDVDEEAVFAELGSKLAFEHNGVVMTLSSQADLAAWKRERQKRWPTKTRMAEKEEERRCTGEERKRLLASTTSSQGLGRTTFAKSKHDRATVLNGKAAAVIEDQQPKVHEPVGPVEPETELERTKRDLTEQTNRLEDLRRKVTESEARNRQAKAQKDANDDRTVAVEADASALHGAETIALPAEKCDVEQDAEVDDEDVLDNSESSPLADSSSVSSDSSSEADSEDGPPEEVSTTRPTAALSDSFTPVCKYFKASGSCRDGDACRFKHEGSQLQQAPRKQAQNASASQRPRMDVNVGRKSIHQRLVEQEQDEENRLALKIIKYLGGVGLFKADVGTETT